MRTSRLVGPLAGLLSAAVGLGVAQLFASALHPAASPVYAVGQAAIDLTPPAAKNFAIGAFGTSDKAVLLTGILSVVAAYAAALGNLATRRLGYGLAGIALFGAVGVVAALSRPGATASDAVPTLAGTAVAALTLRALLRRHSDQAPDDTVPVGIDRRRFLVAGAAAVGTASIAGLAGGALAKRFDVSSARAAVRLPKPSTPINGLPAGVDLRIPGLSPFVTPNSAFYRVDTALLVPQVSPHSWRLRIHGMVQREVVIDFDQLLRLPLVEDYITLCCVSDPVSGPYIGNARWLGARLAPLLRQAGVRAGADQLLCTSSDGFTSGTPVEIVMDGRDALLAVGMNGTPLPVAHGFPARLVVPGLYGYVSATKWLTDIEVTTFARSDAYWVERGWSQQAAIKTESRIDVPADGAKLKAGPTNVAGVAWAQHKGIDAVEVRVDRGPWRQARLATVPGIDTWRQWVWQWHATPGRHRIEARATDATGYTQTSAITPPEPDGATGYPTINVQVG